MLRSEKDLRGFTLAARDGEIGRVKEALFDDERWTVRYLVVETGGWLSGRKVLLSPVSVESAEWEQRRLHVSLTRRQVEESPPTSADQPVSRQQEAELHTYYGWAPYWPGVGITGFGTYPRPPAQMAAAQQDEPTSRGDPHLRSAQEIDGYHVSADDGEIGHISDLLIDEDSWAIRYLIVGTSNWWFGKTVLLGPSRIREISWATKRVVIDITRDAVRNSPEWDPDRPLDEAYEARLARHYAAVAPEPGRTGAGSREAGPRPAPAPADRYVLPPLRYAPDALEPHVSAEVMTLHHDAHHAAYVKGANQALAALARAREEGDYGSIAALERELAFHVSGHVLHSLFWQNLGPGHAPEPRGALARTIERDFGTFGAFRSQMTKAAATIMGSGWAALVWDPLLRRLAVTQIHDHQSQVTQGGVPLLVIDAWEHAYYLQYRNDKARFFDALWNVWNWDDVAMRLEHVQRMDLGLDAVTEWTSQAAPH